MRKICRVVGFILLFFLLTSCDVPIMQDNPSKEQNNDQEYNAFSAAIAKAKDIDYVTITSSAKMVDKNLETKEKNRTTLIDAKQKYSVAQLTNGKYIYYDTNKYIYSAGGLDKTIAYQGKNFTYTSLGLSFLFEDLDFKKQPAFELKDKTAYFKYYGEHEPDIYANVNYDFDTSYSYNNYTNMEIFMEYGESISKIKVNLSKGFESYVTSVEYCYTFNFDAFEKIKVNKSYDETFKVDTAEKLDTYILEMNYEFGDSIFIHSGDFDMLIDAGQPEDGPYVNTFIEEHCKDKVLDVLVVTHAHADHYGGFENGALSSINQIRMIVDYGYSDINGYETVKKSYIKKGASYFPVYNCVNGLDGASKLYRFSDDLTLEFIDTGQYAVPKSYLTASDNQNDYSVVCRVDFGSHSYLYTGDLAGDYENVILGENINDMTVLKLAHHGARSYNSNSVNFLNYVNPDICVVSAAITDEPFNQAHPTQTIVKRVLSLAKISKTKQLYYNGTMGTIHLSDDGGVNLPTVTGLGPNKGYYINGQKVIGEENKKYVDTQLYAKRK